MWFNEMLCAVFKRKKIRQSDVGARLGVSSGTMSFKMNKGKITDRDLDQIGKIIGCDIEIRFIDKKTNEVILEGKL